MKAPWVESNLMRMEYSMGHMCDETVLLESTGQSYCCQDGEWRPVSLAGSPESLVRHYSKKLGKLVAPEEVVKTECWVATEGEPGSLHVENDPLYYTILCLWEKG